MKQSKITSNEIEKQVAIAAKTAATIDKVRVSYMPVANRVAMLFFCCAKLANIDPMYQYSLEWYINLFLLAISEAEVSDAIEERLEFLISTFTVILYKNVCRSLFEKDKLLFSFLLCIEILLGEKTISGVQLRYFLSGNTAVDLAKAQSNGWYGACLAWREGVEGHSWP